MQEVNILTRCIDRHGMDYEKIAQKLATKSRPACIAFCYAYGLNQGPVDSDGLELLFAISDEHRIAASEKRDPKLISSGGARQKHFRLAQQANVGGSPDPAAAAAPKKRGRPSGSGNQAKKPRQSSSSAAKATTNDSEVMSNCLEFLRLAKVVLNKEQYEQLIRHLIAYDKELISVPVLVTSVVGLLGQETQLVGRFAAFLPRSWTITKEQSV